MFVFIDCYFTKSHPAKIVARWLSGRIRAQDYSRNRSSSSHRRRVDVRIRILVCRTVVRYSSLQLVRRSSVSREHGLHNVTFGKSRPTTLHRNVPCCRKPATHRILDHRANLFKRFALRNTSWKRRNFRPISRFRGFALVNYGLYPFHGAYCTKSTSPLASVDILFQRFQIKGQDSLGVSAWPGFYLTQRRRGAEVGIRRQTSPFPPSRDRGENRSGMEVGTPFPVAFQATRWYRRIRIAPTATRGTDARPRTRIATKSIFAHISCEGLRRGRYVRLELRNRLLRHGR